MRRAGAWASTSVGILNGGECVKGMFRPWFKTYISLNRGQSARLVCGLGHVGRSSITEFMGR